MKNCLSLLLVSLVAIGLAQQKTPDPSKASIAYDAMRDRITEPAFGLATIKKLIKKIKQPDDEHAYIPDRAWARLSTKERFTFCAIHGEVMSQNCDGMPPILDEEHRIYPHPAEAFYGQSLWSKRQRQFMTSHRGTVLGLMRQTIRLRGTVGCNLTSIVLDLHYKELIPDLLRVYNRDHKDHDILSTFMAMMNKDHYVPLTKQSWYAKLYGPNANYQATISASTANIKIIERLAMSYARS